MNIDELTKRLQELEGMCADYASRIARMEDVEQITLLKHRYWRAIDSADAELLASVLTEDFTAHMQGSAFDLTVTSRQQFIEQILATMTDDTAAQHHGHHPEITIESENEASGIWYLQDIVHRAAANLLTVGTCFYHDRYVRTEEGWRLASTQWGRHVEVRQPLTVPVRFTDRYLATHGRPAGGRAH